MTNKMTNKIALEIAIEAVNALGNTEAVEKLEKMLAQTVKKSSAERKLTATQKENIELKEAILKAMEVGKQYTITELTKSVEAIAELSNQRVSALVRQMKEEGKVTREEIKRKAYFSIVEA